MMSIPRAALGPLLLLTLLAGLALGRPAASEAASIPVRTCSGANAAIPGGFATAGQWVVLENNVGQRPSWGSSTNLGASPVCAVRSTGTGTTGAPQWVFCTQASLYGCGQDAFGTVSLGTDLDARARAQIAWAIATADVSKPLGRAIAQLRVWCVSERVQRGRSDADIVAAARDHFADQGIALPAGAACPDWRAVDPGLRTKPQLAARATAATVPAGGVARFEVTTNLPEVRVSGPASLDLCPDAPAGVALSGGTLMVDGTADARARTVPLCAPAAAAGGTARLEVSAPSVLAADLTAIRSVRSPSTCQLMVTDRRTRLAAAATVATAPAPAPVAPAAAAPAPPTVQIAQSAPAPRLTIAKRRVRRTGEARRVRSGGAVRWAITVRNTGDAAARDVRVCDTLRRGLAVVRTTPRATPSGGRVCWRLRTLAAGARATLRITTRVSVGAGGARCQRLANRATIVGGPSDSSTVTVCRRTRTRSGGTTG